MIDGTKQAKSVSLVGHISNRLSVMVSVRNKSHKGYIYYNQESVELSSILCQKLGSRAMEKLVT